MRSVALSMTAALLDRLYPSYGQQRQAGRQEQQAQQGGVVHAAGQGGEYYIRYWWVHEGQWLCNTHPPTCTPSLCLPSHTTHLTLPSQAASLLPHTTFLFFCCCHQLFFMVVFFTLLLMYVILLSENVLLLTVITVSFYIVFYSI